MSKPKLIYSTKLLRETRRTIGQQIHTARLAQRMPLRKLAKLTGIPAEKLDMFELGKGEIRLDEMLKVGCVLF